MKKIISLLLCVILLSSCSGSKQIQFRESFKQVEVRVLSKYDENKSYFVMVQPLDKDHNSPFVLTTNEDFYNYFTVNETYLVKFEVRISGEESKLQRFELTFMGLDK